MIALLPRFRRAARERGEGSPRCGRTCRYVTSASRWGRKPLCRISPMPARGAGRTIASCLQPASEAELAESLGRALDAPGLSDPPVPHGEEVDLVDVLHAPTGRILAPPGPRCVPGQRKRPTTRRPPATSSTVRISTSGKATRKGLTARRPTTSRSSSKRGGDDIGIHGSIELMRSLLRADLVDELKLGLAGGRDR